MPTDLFISLKDVKKNSVITAALEEFASQGMVNSSTNNIVKKCGISKGSLFKYFETKDDLCFYLFDSISSEMMTDLATNIESFSTEVFQRIIDYSTWEIGWYISNPVKGRFMLEFTKEDDREFSKKREDRYGQLSQNAYYELFQAVSEDSLNIDKSMAANLIKWMLEGYNKEFLQREDISIKSFEVLKEEYLEGVTNCLEALKKGIIKE